MYFYSHLNLLKMSFLAWILLHFPCVGHPEIYQPNYGIVLKFTLLLP